MSDWSGFFQIPATVSDNGATSETDIAPTSGRQVFVDWAAGEGYASPEFYAHREKYYLWFRTLFVGIGSGSMSGLGVTVDRGARESGGGRWLAVGR